MGQLGRKGTERSFEERELRLLQQKRRLDREEAMAGWDDKKTEASLIKLDTQMEIVDHEIDMAEDELKAARRALRRR